MRPEEILPHRFPFLLVDRILEIVPGEKILAVKRLSASDRLLSQTTALPGVFLLEACAQLCGLANVSLEESGSLEEDGALEEEPGQVTQPQPGYLVGIEAFEVLAQARVGDSVELEVQLGRGFGKLQKVSFETRVEGEALSRGNLTVLNP